MNKTFTINEISIVIEAITPTTTLSSYNGFTNFVKEVQIDYAFYFRDITLPVDTDITTQRTVIKLNVDVDDELFTNFIEFTDLTKEDFYPLAIKTANESQKILDMVKFLRVRTGLDIEPPRTLPVSNRTSKHIPFK